MTRYEVNLLVSHADAAAPIVYESHPSLQNLLGRVEHVAQFGALLTNFTMIRAGVLHRANGGYLILDADRLLAEPLAWSALKLSSPRFIVMDRLRVAIAGLRNAVRALSQ